MVLDCSFFSFSRNRGISLTIFVISKDVDFVTVWPVARPAPPVVAYQRQITNCKCGTLPAFWTIENSLSVERVSDLFHDRLIFELVDSCDRVAAGKFLSYALSDRSNYVALKHLGQPACDCLEHFTLRLAFLLFLYG